MLKPFWLIHFIPYGTFTSLPRANKRKMCSDIMQLSGLAQNPVIDFIVFGGFCDANSLTDNTNGLG